MIKLIGIMLLLFNISMAQNIDFQDINISKYTIQIAVSKNKPQIIKLQHKLSKYETVIDKKNSYTLYIVNVSKLDRYKILKKIQNNYVDDAYILKSDFFKNKINKEINKKTVKAVKQNIKHTQKQTILIGANINKITNIDLAKKTVKLDFYLWLKSKNPINTENIIFTNSVNKIDFNNSKNVKLQGLYYKRFHINEIFYIDFEQGNFSYTQHLIGFQILNDMKSKDNIEFIVDKKFIDNKHIKIDDSFKIKTILTYIKDINSNTQADPTLTQNGKKIFINSTFNINIMVNDHYIDFENLLTFNHALILFIFAFILLYVLKYLKDYIYKQKFLKLINLPMNENTLYHLTGIINFKTILSISQQLESILSNEDGVLSTKEQTIFEVSMEIIENMLKHSLNTIDIGYNKLETKGSFQLIYNKNRNTYFIKSCNLIDESNMYIIKDKIETYKKLEDKQLRKLAREKLKNKDEQNSDTGLGYILLTRRSTSPINIKFETIKENVIKFTLEIRIKYDDN